MSNSTKNYIWKFNPKCEIQIKKNFYTTTADVAARVTGIDEEREREREYEQERIQWLLMVCVGSKIYTYICIFFWNDTCLINNKENTAPTEFHARSNEFIGLQKISSSGSQQQWNHCNKIHFAHSLSLSHARNLTHTLTHRHWLDIKMDNDYL